MKEQLEKINEAEVVACVVAAAIIAAILMVGDALWKGVTGKKTKCFPTKKHLKAEPGSKAKRESGFSSAVQSRSRLARMMVAS